MKTKEDILKKFPCNRVLKAGKEYWGKYTLLKAMDEYAEQFQLMPQMKIEKHKIDLHDGYFYTAELIGIKGMIVQAETKEQAIEELMTSIKVKLLYDSGA